MPAFCRAPALALLLALGLGGCATSAAPMPRAAMPPGAQPAAPADANAVILPPKY